MISPSEVNEFDAWPVRDARRHGQAALVERVIQFIERHYTEQLTLRDVARAFNYSPCHLTNLFSQIVGMPINAWIIKRRIVAAQKLLAEQNVGVASTCEAVGFNDLCYFTRQFTRHVGTTPGRYRAAMNGKPRRSSASPEQETLQERPGDLRTGHVSVAGDESVARQVTDGLAGRKRLV